MTKPDQKKFILFGNNPKKVIKKIWQKKSNHKNPKTKLGLIIEGGGMRSIIAGGLLVAMHQLGFTETFNKVYGTSAGAIAGAYFLAKETPYGISIFYEEINNKKFINIHKVPHFLNIDYLIDVIKNKKKLNTQTIRQSPSELIINATDIETGKAKFFSSKKDLDVDIIKAIKASCALPIYYDKPIKIKGRKYLDGGVVTSFPIEKAVADGCTDILIIMTKSQNGKIAAEHSAMPLWFQMLWLKKYNQEFVDSYFAKHKARNHLIELIKGQAPLTKNIDIAAIAPTNQNVSLFTLDPTKLKNSYKDSYQAGLNILQKFE